MKQKIKQSLMAIVALLLSSTVFAHNFEVDGIYYNYIDETAKTVKVTYKGSSYSSYSNEYTGSVSIPSTVTFYGTTYSVTSIGYSAFDGCTSLTSVTIPNSVTEIGKDAFEGCTGLTSIVVNGGNSKYDSRDNCNAIIETATNKLICGCKNTIIPNSVTSIGEEAFAYCTGLTSITIPNSVTEIGGSAFSGCTGLTSITIPNSVTSIGAYAFNNCTGLTEVTIPNSVTEIGDSAFMGCTALETINFNAVDCKKMGRSNYLAFDGCSAIKNINIGKNVKVIPNYAFYDCNGVESIILPENLTQIGSFAFYGLDKISLITFPKTLTSIGNSAFQYCSDLSSVIIPDMVKTIGEKAFYCCSGLRSLTIGVSVASIGSSAFSNPNKTIWLTNMPPTGYTNAKGGINIVPNDSYSSFNNVSVYPYISSMFEIDGIKYVPVSPSEHTCDIIDCLYDTTMTTISIEPKIMYKGIEMSLNDINISAFINNKYIKSVEITFLGNIGKSAFSNCNSIDNVVVNASTIGDYAFYKCGNLKNVIIGNEVDTVGDNSFSDCVNLNSLSFGENVKVVGNNAFSGCYELKGVAFGDKVETIGDFAFSNCSSLETFEFGTSMKTIGKEAFSDCTSLVKLRSKAMAPPACSTYALDDINKWNCELIVRDAAISAYQSADQWKEFFFISPDDVENIEIDGAIAQISIENGNIIINDIENPQVELYNINGQCIYCGNETSIPVSTNGIYILKINSKSYKIAI